MKISKLTFTDNKHKKPLINSKSTGVLAAVSLGATLGAVAFKNKRLKNTHKYLAVATGVFTVLHILLVESFKKQYRKNK